MARAACQRAACCECRKKCESGLSAKPACLLSLEAFSIAQPPCHATKNHTLGRWGAEKAEIGPKDRDPEVRTRLGAPGRAY